MLPTTRVQVSPRNDKTNETSYFVPLRFLHFLGLPLCGENKTGSQGRDSSFSNGLLGVPYCIKDIIKERLHLLKEEGGCTHSQLPQYQDLKNREFKYYFQDKSNLYYLQLDN